MDLQSRGHSSQQQSTSADPVVSSFSEDRNDSYDDSSLNHLSASARRSSTRLPIHSYKEELLYLIENNRVVIICGETGSGKSTQIPQFLYRYGWTGGSNPIKRVGITQPRVISAVSLASRVAGELNCQIGSSVGFTVRFDDHTDANETHIKYMTEGILIRELMSEPLLDSYSVIMVDEVHERSVNTDILLALLKRILERRPDLKLILSSATIDPATLAKFFSTNAVLSVQGKSYPIQIHHMKEPVADYVKASIDTVIRIHEEEMPGDILVFLTGSDEVSEVVSTLMDYVRTEKQNASGDRKQKLFVLPLHSSLPSRDIFKVFETLPRSLRKVVVATNVAEASVTIPNITYVIDCGFVKMKFYSPITCSDSLVIVPISKSSAVQRSGRAGRTRAGKVYRLYTEKSFESLTQFTIPEIERTSTAGLLLQLKALGIHNILDLDMLCKPSDAQLASGLELLHALGALDDECNLMEPLGLQMAEFPCPPMLAKCLIEASKYSCTLEVVAIASMLMVESIFQSPSSGQRAIAARRAKHALAVEEGDLITYLNIHLQFVRQDMSQSWADKNYLKYKALARSVEIADRLKSLLRRFKIQLVSSDGDLDSVRKALVTGFFANAVYLSGSTDERAIYKTVKGDHTLYLHPSSVVFTASRPPKWLVYNELLHTSDDFIRDVLAIEPSWLYELAPHYYEFGTEREIREKRLKQF